MVDLGRGAPPRFRRRLTAAFVIVAAAASGVLAVVTYTLSSGYRTQTFEQRSYEEAELALALAPRELTDTSFERLQAAYEARTGASTVARTDVRYYSSSPGIGEADIPPELRDPVGPELVSAHAVVNGVRRLVLASARESGDFWFFFSTEPVERSLEDLRVVLGVSWLLTTGGAALVGRSIARRTLSPVRRASEAARSLAGGLLETRLEPGSDDEFGTWSDSFNEMAAALQATIGRLEAAAQRERQFTADIAHELRTPLTGMAAGASLLEDELDVLPDRAQRAARILLNDVRRLRDLVLELLELARMDAGSEPLRSEPLLVHRALAAVVDTAVAAHDGVEVLVDAPDELTVSADRARLRRVLANLVDNAIRHGAPPVEITARTEGSEVVIEVHDHGTGLAMEDPSVLFDRFTKSDRSRGGGGSGLGLAIASGHAEAMGGTLAASNGADGGATFVLRLPLGADPSTASPTAEPPEG